jgi:hypothetical protein
MPEHVLVSAAAISWGLEPNEQAASNSMAATAAISFAWVLIGSPRFCSGQTRERIPSNAWARKIAAPTKPITAVIVSNITNVLYATARQETAATLHSQKDFRAPTHNPIDRGFCATDVHRLVIQRQEFVILRHTRHGAGTPAAPSAEEKPRLNWPTISGATFQPGNDLFCDHRSSFCESAPYRGKCLIRFHTMCDL